MSEKKKTLGWNPTYFGEPKPGSLAAVIADVTTKQNAVVGDKPEVQSSAAEQAKEQAISFFKHFYHHWQMDKELDKKKKVVSLQEYKNHDGR